MDTTITLLLTYKYLILLPLAIVEGPIVTVIAGFMITLGLLNIGLVYLVVILGDIIGDTAIYCFGRFGGNTILSRHGHKVGLTAERIQQAKEYFGNNHKKALAMSKLIHGIGMAGLFTAGSLKINYFHYIRICLLISLIQSGILLFLGIFFGHAYVQIGQYFDYFAATGSVVALAIIAFFIFKKFVK